MNDQNTQNRLSRVWGALWQKKNIPNFITGISIVLFLFVIAGFVITYRKHEVWHAVIFFIGAIAYLLDGLDGKIARRYNWQSEFGRIFDPAGDKIRAIAILSYFYIIGIFPLWILAIVLFRDLVLSTLRLVSMKENLDFKTSSMGKLRTNIIGYGGAVIYFIHYWGEIFLEKVGVIHLILAIITFAVILNIGILPDKFLLKMFPRFRDKLGAVITFVILAINPSVTIPYAIAWITIYSLVDYGIAFGETVEAAKERIKLRLFLKKSLLQIVLAVVLTGLVLLLLQESLFSAILLSSVIFIILFWRNVLYIQIQPKKTPLKQTTTSVSCPARPT